MNMSKRTRSSLIKIGLDLSLARRRRHISMQSMAERVGTSVSTLGRIEKGDPTVSWGTVVTAMDILGFEKSLVEVTDSAHDELGLGIMDSNVPQRIRRRSIKKTTGAL